MNTTTPCETVQVHLDPSGGSKEEHRNAAGAQADYALSHDAGIRAARARIEESERRSVGTVGPNIFDSGRAMVAAAVVGYGLADATFSEATGFTRTLAPEIPNRWYEWAFHAGVFAVGAVSSWVFWKDS